MTPALQARQHHGGPEEISQTALGDAGRWLTYGHRFERLESEKLWINRRADMKTKGRVQVAGTQKRPVASIKQAPLPIVFGFWRLADGARH